MQAQKELVRGSSLEDSFYEFTNSRQIFFFRTENLILVQIERWRRG